MKHVVVMDESDYKEVVSALRILRYAVNSLEATNMSGELLDRNLERVEQVFNMEEQT